LVGNARNTQLKPVQLAVTWSDDRDGHGFRDQKTDQGRLPIIPASNRIRTNGLAKDFSSVKAEEAREHRFIYIVLLQYSIA
jgi:hypothetical protein